MKIPISLWIAQKEQAEWSIKGKDRALEVKRIKRDMLRWNNRKGITDFHFRTLLLLGAI